MDVLTFSPKSRHCAQPLFLVALVSLLSAVGFVINFGTLYPITIGWVLLSSVALAVALAQLRQGRHSLVADDRGLLLLIDQTVVPIRWDQIQRLDLIAEQQLLGIRLKPNAHVWQQLSPRQLRRWCRISQGQLRQFGAPAITEGLLAQPDLLHQQQYLSQQLADRSGFHILLSQGEFNDDLDQIVGQLRRAHQEFMWHQPKRDATVTPIDANTTQGTREARALRSGDSRR
ncbi:hypothetical protein FCL40_07570 [Ferrimonas sediminicola]|uniref:DUF2982 domain-containing protein n=1 Tax=Ferrimonas sediminicola TaxID=2569538 RepID=A0A4V5NVC7_9GAMM|nr:hypothetical protein [Ferrimonas sediminicola]TKB49999.1 hypothetical protein FCL40_07570 [Ferrimonas sediminicola]